MPTKSAWVLYCLVLMFLATGRFSHAKRTAISQRLPEADNTCDNIQGELVLASEKKKTPTKIYTGLNQSEDCIYRNGMKKGPIRLHFCSNKKTLSGLNGQRLHREFSLACNVTDGSKVIDTKDKFLPTRSTLPGNLYGFEFRFRQKAFELDQFVVVCPLKRRACTYIMGIVLKCSPIGDKYFLAGYRLELNIREAFRDRQKYPAVDDDFVDDKFYPKRWWTVQSCTAEAIEVGISLLLVLR